MDSLHQRASQAKHAQQDEGGMRDAVMQLEQLADRAMQACRNAGGNVDPQLKDAVQRAHSEASQLKKQVTAGSAA